MSLYTISHWHPDQQCSHADNQEDQAQPVCHPQHLKRPMVGCRHQRECSEDLTHCDTCMAINDMGSAVQCPVDKDTVRDAAVCMSVDDKYLVRHGPLCRSKRTQSMVTRD